MFRTINSIGLRSRFVLIGIAVLVPLVAVMLQLAQYERESALASAEQRVKLIASLSADRQHRLVQQAHLALSGIAGSWQLLAAPESCQAVMVEAMERHEWLTGLRVSSLDGTGVCADRPEILRLDIADRGYFQAVVAGEEFAVSDKLISRRANAQPIIGVAVPIRYGDRLTGVLHGAIELSELAEVLPAELTGDPDIVVDLIDGNGRLLARHPPDADLVAQPELDSPVLARALQRPSGAVELIDLKGKLRLFAFQKVDALDWVVAVGLDRAAVVGPINASLHQRLALIAVIVLSSCVIGLVGGEAFVFWPLRELAQTARELERGNLAARPRLTGLSEVGALEHSLSRMAEAIQQREADLKASQAAWEQAVSDTKRANDAKSQFLASMSHEIRTPLSGIVGYNDLLLAQELPPVQRRYAEGIEVAAAAMISVIDGILDIARIEAGEVEIEQRPFSLPGLVDNAIAMIRPRADRKGLDLSFELDPKLPAAVVGDEARLRQVLLNLLSNAVKFTHDGSVTLRIHATQGHHVRFSVTDTGAGIAKEQHRKLFKRYSQAHDVSRGNDGGSGLGLAICKELTGLMGGQLGFSSEPGRGSTFWVELTLPPAEASEIVRQPAPTRAPKTGRILVADDNEMNREITSAMLTLAGHDVDVVADGSQALAAFGKKAYDLVLLDIEMRGMNGLKAAQHIRQLPPPAGHVPVIAMTANVLPQQIRAFEAAGMDGHLGKPFTRSQLIDKVNLFLSPVRAAAGDMTRPSASRAATFDEKALAEMKLLIGEQRTAAWIGALRTQLELLLSIDQRPVSRPKLARMAHTMVSQAGSLGFIKLSRLASELEEACTQRTDHREILARIEKACQSALRRLDKIQESDGLAVHLSGAEHR